MHKIIKVIVLDGYRLDLIFDDQTRGIVDLSGLVGRGVFTLWHDYNVFRKVEIGQAGELVWVEQLDLCPDSLYLKVTGRKPEDVFPALKHELAYA